MASWSGRTVLVECIESNRETLFHWHVEETQGKSVLKIPSWMFDSSWEHIRLRDTPAVGCEALRNLKRVLASAPSRDQIVKEAQRFEGGADATITKSKTISVGTVSTANQNANLARNGSGGEGKDDTVAVPIAPPVSGRQEWPGFNGGQP
jgi:hypothetical protein